MNVKKLNQKGIGLIETLLAVGVGIIVITSMVALAVFTVRASLQSQLTLKGSQLASQEIELVRAYRDTRTWSEFLTGMNSCFTGDCYMSNVGSVAVASGQYSEGLGAKEITRYFTLTNLTGGAIVDAELVRVNVTVQWQIGDDIKTAHNYTELSNWRDR